MITREVLASSLKYDPETGAFARTRGGSGVKGPIGSRAGSLTPQGYRILFIKGRSYKEHRLAFLWMTGSFPEGDVDHINMDRADNRWANLRASSRSQNQANTRLRPSNKTGLKGVSFKERSQTWVAQLTVNRSTRNLGEFSCPAAASLAYAVAAHAAFGGYSRSH